MRDLYHRVSLQIPAAGVCTALGPSFTATNVLGGFSALSTGKRSAHRVGPLQCLDTGNSVSTVAAVRRC